MRCTYCMRMWVKLLYNAIILTRSRTSTELGTYLLIDFSNSGIDAPIANDVHRKSRFNIIRGSAAKTRPKYQFENIFLGRSKICHDHTRHSRDLNFFNRNILYFQTQKKKCFISVFNIYNIPHKKHNIIT